MADSSASSLARAGRALSLGGATLGLLGLAGWLLDVGALTTFVAGRPAMMPNTALTLVAIGVCAALRSTRPSARGSAILTGTLALFTFVIGFATVAEYALGRDLGIDQLLVSLPVATDGPYPGRPSPLTGVALTLLGLAALPPPRYARLTVLAQWLVLAAMFVAFVVIVDHLFGAGVVYQLRTAPVTGVAVPTALALLLISFGMLLGDRASTLTALLASSSPGGFLLRRLGVAVVLAIPTLGVLAFRAMSRAGIEDIPLILAVLTTAGVPLALAALVFTASRLDRAHVELESNRERARLLVEDSADAIFVADLAGRYTDVNAAGCRLLGFAKEEIVGKTILDFIPPDESRRLAAARERLAAGAAETEEWQLRRRNGSYVPVEVSTKILADGRWQGIVRDITRRRAAEDAARRSEARLEGIISIAADAVICVDDDQRILTYNAGAQRIFGWSYGEVAGKSLDMLLPARLAQLHRQHIRDFAREDTAARMMNGRPEVTGLRKNGEEFFAEAAISRLDQDGQRIFTVFLRDTTQTRRLEEELRLGVERFRLLAEAGEALTSSLSAEEFLPRVAELAVRSIADCCVVERVDTPGLTIVRCAAGAVGDRESPVVPAALHVREPLLVADVSPAWLRSHGAGPALTALVGDASTSLIAVPIGIGERLVGVMLLLSGAHRRYVHADLQLAIDLARRTGLAVENERLYRKEQTATRARDQLLGIVAHDLRSPLAAVQFGADNLARMVPDERRRATQRSVESIQHSVRRAMRLLDDLLDVARLEEGRFAVAVKEVSAEALVAGAVESFAPVAASALVTLKADVSPGLSPVMADEDRIYQVLGNLLDNAIKFTPAGGCVRIAVTPTTGGVRFTVADTGPGIPPEHLPHLFDRFWQARSSRRGAGLGLAIAKGIIEAHGSSIWVESTLGQGTTFTFALPTRTNLSNQLDDHGVDVGAPELEASPGEQPA